MSDIDLAALRTGPHPRPNRRAIARGLFGSVPNTLLTLLVVAGLAWAGGPVLRWAVFDATWGGTGADCAMRDGACWAFLGTKLRFILFAFYPPELHWRPVLTLVLIFGLLGVSAVPRFWGRRLLLAWPATIAAAWALMAAVPTSRWGGLPLTLLVWSACFATATPLGILLALARRSRLGGVRTLAVLHIELMRGIPMVAILYFAMLILPMALPGGQFLDKLMRAMAMIVPFWAAYIAEVVRAGLQAIPPGQQEAATALGLGYWRRMRLIVLPQGLRLVIPGLVNLAIGFFLATSLLAVIGLFDLLNTARTAALDPNWLGFYDEAYLFVGLVYLAIAFVGSRYSLWLERRLKGLPRKPPIGTL